MRYRQILLVGLGLLSFCATASGQLQSQQRHNARILRYPVEQAPTRYFVTLMGEVARPGVYEFDQPDLRLPQLVELAGGLKEDSASRNVYSFRNGRQGPQTFFTPDSSFTVLPGDILMVGRRPDYGVIRQTSAGQTTASPPEQPQIAVLGLIERPVLLHLPLNMSSIPGLFALLHQDRNPGRTIAVYPPNAAPFSYTAQNSQPVPLSSGTIVMFDPQTVLRDGLPQLPPVINHRPAVDPANDPTRNAVQHVGPKILVAPGVSTTLPTPHSPSDFGSVPPEMNAAYQEAPINRGTPAYTEPLMVPSQPETAPQNVPQQISQPAPNSDAAHSNSPAPRFQQVPAARQPEQQAAPEVVPGEKSSEEETGLQFPQHSDARVRHASASRDPDPAARSQSLPSDDQVLEEELEELAEEEEGPSAATPKTPAKRTKIATAQTPVWLLMVIVGIGFFCVSGLVILLKDLNQFKKIVLETRESQSVLDQLIRGELPLHEETVDFSHSQHFTARPTPPVRRYRADAAHREDDQERWVPQPHVSFEAAEETSESRYGGSVRIDRETERGTSSRTGRPTTAARPSAAKSQAASSSTVLDRILSTVNGDRNARRA